MSETVTGVVQSVRKDRKGIKIHDEWYSVFAASELGEVQKGYKVSLSFTRKGKWNNITADSIEILEDTPAQSSGDGGGYGGGDKQFRTVPELNRIDALREAVALASASSTGDLKSDTKAVLKLAPVFVAFIEGAIKGAPGKSSGSSSVADADAAAKAEAERKRQAEEERKRREAEDKARQEAAGSALDDFLGDD